MSDQISDVINVIRYFGINNKPAFHLFPEVRLRELQYHVHMSNSCSQAVYLYGPFTRVKRILCIL